MTVAVVKTKAEQDLGRRFAGMAPALPGGDWVSALRREAIGAFEALGLPGRRVEAFKYTDLRQRITEAFPMGGDAAEISPASLARALGPLADLDADRLVLVDGAFSATLSETSGFGDVAEVMALAPLLAKAPQWLAGKFSSDRLGTYDGVTALNTAFMSDGVLLKIKPGCRARRPILLVHARASGTPSATFTRSILAIEEASSATVIEAFVAIDGAGPGQGNSFADVTVAKGGRLDHVVCRIGDGAEQDVAHTTATIGSEARYRMFQLIAGAQLARHQTLLKLVSEGGSAEVAGVLLGSGRDHIDASLVVDHVAPGCQSREFFKAVLADAARGVFQGKAIVRPGAQKTDGQMLAHALMLGEEAEFDSKPELEIYADDVQCGHGSTCSDLDPNQMFFCQSRGLSEAEARALLMRGFAGDVIDRIDNETVRAALGDVAGLWLGRTSGGMGGNRG